MNGVDSITRQGIVESLLGFTPELVNGSMADDSILRTSLSSRRRESTSEVNMREAQLLRALRVKIASTVRRAVLLSAFSFVSNLPESGKVSLTSSMEPNLRRLESS